jgi:hypothetical protein
MSEKITRWLIFGNKGDPCFQATRYTADQNYINEQIENHKAFYEQVYLVAEFSDIEFGKKCLQSAYNDLRDLVEVTPQTTKHFIKALEIIGRVLRL